MDRPRHMYHQQQRQMEMNVAFRDLLDEAGKASQFYLELQDLKALEREEQPRIFHLNPWLKGDWSGKPVTEQNTCYRMQWGSSTKM
ncbi:hypothetical protein HID58_084718 [Brassica napus]|uniref:Galectin domain-containing protein n=1 Tax=Brassica napus TaxID=3708 RepID=A0ABQ7XKH7_BRANA|nr:hypothetical protein HID58_084718 [Brassica napus]